MPDDTRVVVDLLKLAVSCRSGEKGKEVLSAVLSGMGTAYPQVTGCVLLNRQDLGLIVLTFFTLLVCPCCSGC